MWSYKKLRIASTGTSAVSRGNYLLLIRLTRLFFLEADYAPGELPVHVKGLLSSDRVFPDNGVDVFHRFPTHDTTALARARVLGLLVSRVYGLERLQERDEVGRKTLQRGDLRCEDSVATGVGGGDEEEGGQARRLVLVADVGVPRGCNSVLTLLIVERRRPVAVDEVQVWIALWMAGRRVDVQSAEVPTYAK